MLGLHKRVNADTTLGPLEMISPIFDVYPLSGWRRHVIATWNFLEQHYAITTGDSCSTHIHVSLVPHYDLKDLKRVAVSIIHFEPAFEALMPEARRGNPFCQSNWLDSPRLAPAGLSRSESIAEIERKLDAYHVIASIQNGGDKCFAWNFESLKEHSTIEFRKPPASSSADEALSWAELALNFIQASLKYGTSRRLKMIPSTIRGLRWFLEQVYVPGINVPSRLDRIWAGKDENAALEPWVWSRRKLNGDMSLDARLRKLSAADLELVLTQAKFSKEPYWPREGTS